MPALATLKGLVIDDPCLDGYRVNEYSDLLHVQAIDNIHEVGINPDAIDSLVALAVKAIMLAPIVSDRNELFGAIAVHQCFGYRNWQDVEVEWLQANRYPNWFSFSKSPITRRNHRDEIFTQASRCSQRNN